MGPRFFLSIRISSFLLTILCATAWSSVAGAVSGGARGTVYSHSQTSFTDPNAAGPPVPGVQVTMSYCKSWTLVRAVQALIWTCNSFGSKSATTDANGAYSISVSDAMNPPGTLQGQRVATFSLPAGAGDEASGPGAITTFSGGIVSGKDFKRVALMRSPNGAMWLRRYGTGDYPFFFVEGFDPQDPTRTGDELIPGGNSLGLASPSILRLMRSSPLGSATFPPPAGANNNMLDFLVSNNYSVYIIASGKNWARSQSGSLADHSDGMAYQAMALVKQAQQRFAPSRSIIVGGYSLGGSVVRTGLRHWCNGAFAGIPGSLLANNCWEVGLWWSADSPLDSATVPASLIRLMKDTALDSKPLAASYRAMMDSGAARELLDTWTTAGCTTGCLDDNGCKSAMAGFDAGCSVDNTARTNFQTWNGMPTGRLSGTTHAQVQNGMPMRGGSPIPAVAFSLGRSPQIGFLPEAQSFNGPQSNGQLRFMRVHITGSAEALGFIPLGSVDAWVELHVKTDEVRSGSRMDMLDDIRTVDGASGSAFWGLVSGQGAVSDPIFDFHPTFVTARSALLWSSSVQQPPPFWMDWRANTVDANHSDPFPSNETGMVLAWASEFSKGYRSAPVATGVKTPNLSSRAPSKEQVDGRDDDGDEQVDEMQPWDGQGLTAAFADASNRYLTFVSQNRYWKYDSLEDVFMWQHTGYFGQGKYVPEVPMGNASTWFNAPLVDGLKPWDGWGITAAYNAPATGDENGPAQFIVLFSQDKYWVYRGGANGEQSWIACGRVGDGRWLPRILPYFDGYMPTVNGVYPWDLMGITGIHHNEWGRTDQIQIASEGRSWTFNFMDGTWSQPWVRNGIITASWTTYDRSIQCIAGNNACTWFDCGSAQYWEGGFTNATCFTMQGGWTPRNQFNISAWGSGPVVVRNGITNIQSFTPSAGTNCPSAATILTACKDKQICNYSLPQGCAGTARYVCASYNNTDWNQASAPAGGTLGMACPW
jgi:hypothetical protein